MEKVEVKLMVAKETHEVALLVGALVAESIKLIKAKAPTDKVVEALIAIVPKLSAAIDGIDKLDDEFKEDAMASIMAMMMPVMEGIKPLLEKKKEEVKEA